MSIDKTKRVSRTLIRKTGGQKGAVKIYLSKKPKPRAAEPEPAIREEGMVYVPQRPTEYIVPQKKGIRVYDLGRLADGTPLEFIRQPVLNFPNPGLPDPTAADFADRDAFLLDGVSSLESYYYEIKQADGDYYRLGVYNYDASESTIFTSDSALWTTKGLNIPQATLDADLAFFPEYVSNLNWRLGLFETVRPSTRKVTASYDYDADAVVGFKFKKGDKIFLMPSLVLYRNYVDYFAGTRYLNFDHRFGFREPYFEIFNPTVDPSFDEFSTSGPIGNYEQAYQALQYHAALNSARLYFVYFDFDLGDWVSEEILDTTEITPSAYFSPTSGPASAHVLHSSTLQIIKPEGTLLAIVKRGGTNYYIWTNV